MCTYPTYEINTFIIYACYTYNVHSKDKVCNVYFISTLCT